jgi:hypothetical protein
VPLRLDDDRDAAPRLPPPRDAVRPRTDDERLLDDPDRADAVRRAVEPVRAELRLRALAERAAVRRRVVRLPFRRNSAGISVFATSLTSCGISF